MDSYLVNVAENFYVVMQLFPLHPQWQDVCVFLLVDLEGDGNCVQTNVEDAANWLLIMFSPPSGFPLWKRAVCEIENNTFAMVDRVRFPLQRQTNKGEVKNISYEILETIPLGGRSRNWIFYI